MRRRYVLTGEEARAALPVRIHKAPNLPEVYEEGVYLVDVDGVSVGEYDTATNTLQLEATFFGPWSKHSYAWTTIKELVRKRFGKLPKIVVES
jgi:hypothetical protein